MEPIAVMPIYLDWSFWAVIVAAIAIVLSQVPPVHLLLKRSKLDLEAYSKIVISHKVGNPNVQLHVIISNVGGRRVRIRGIKITVYRDAELVASMPAQNYFQEPADQNTVLLTSFTLCPGEEWGHIVNFLNFYSRDDEREYRAMEKTLKEDLVEKQSKVKGEPKELLEANPEHVAPFHEFFARRFIWKAGDYKFQVSVQTDPAMAAVVKVYRFTLFESYEDELRAITREYKYGAGIYWNSSTLNVVIVDINEP